MKMTGYIFRIGVVVSVALAGVMAAGVIRDRGVQSSLLRKGIQERAKTAVSLVQPGIEKGLRTNDDILLLIQLESLSRTDDAQAAYLLDRAGKVVIHTRTSEWGREYKDAYSMAAARASRPLFQEISSPHSYVYTVPVSSQAVLSVAYSAQKNDELLSAAGRRLIYGGLAFFIIIYLLVYIFALMPLKRSMASLTASLKGIIPGTGSRVPPLTGECGDISLLVNGILDKCGLRSTPPSPDASSSLEKTVLAFFAADEECLALFDKENLLVAATPRARDFFTVKDAVGKHIIDILAPEIVSIAQDARQNAGKAARRTIQGKTYECRVLTDDNHTTAGLIVRKLSE